MSDLTNWQPYKGQYVKAYMDIVLKDGTLIERCWPNAGTFHDAAGKRTIEGRNVGQVRRSADQSPTISFGRPRHYGRTGGRS